MINKSNFNHLIKIRYLMTPEEIEQLRQGLKKKWEAVNKEY